MVDVLERDGKGLNLTSEVREGILKHSKTRAEILGEGWGTVDTLEGQVCKLADIIAYLNHDIDDALRAGIIINDELPHSAIAVLGQSHSERINTMVCDVVDYSWAATGLSDNLAQKPAIGMSSAVQEAANSLREFLFDRVYNPNLAKKETDRAREVIRLLYKYFIKHQQKLPEEYALHSDSVEQRVIDYIAGMTDQYALRTAEEVSPLRSEL